jgi:hypothetical protein
MAIRLQTSFNEGSECEGEREQGDYMTFVTVGRFVINTSMIIAIEIYRPGNGSEVKVNGLQHAIKLSDQETEALLDLIQPIGGMPTPIQGEIA